VVAARDIAPTHPTRLHRPGYLRYVDDFVIFGESAADLTEVRERCREFLAGLRLKMHPKKCVISRVETGTRFLGLQVFPRFCRLPRPWRVRTRRRLCKLAAAYQSHKIDWRDVARRVAALKGHAFWSGARRWLQAAMQDAAFPARLISRCFQSC
jgi:RNA-directed DNA polymerase